MQYNSYIHNNLSQGMNVPLYRKRKTAVGHELDELHQAVYHLADVIDAIYGKETLHKADFDTLTKAYDRMILSKVRLYNLSGIDVPVDVYEH